MRPEGDIHVGDVGTALRVEMVDGGDPVDISGANKKEIGLQKPDGTVEWKTASLVNDGTDGMMQYVTQDGDLDQAGTWRIAGYVELSGWSGTSDSDRFQVRAQALERP